jgi:hypothetical protein
MKFELIPNEILIECFEYLNALHIFHSFDQLNYRSSTLIRSVPLYVDFRNIHPRIICDQFSMKLLSDQETRKQIYALHLSNKDTCYSIQSFLSLFSLDEFLHLRSLTLTKVTRDNFEKLKTRLPLVTELVSFGLIDDKQGNSSVIFRQLHI